MKQTEGPDLSTVACPTCQTVGSLSLQSRMVTCPLGTWSLAGQQLKTPAVEVPHVVCTAGGCDFAKAPKGRAG